MKLAKLNLGRILGLAGLAVLLAGLAMAPTRAQQGSLVGGTVYAPPGTWVSYSPAQLGANGIALPASGSSADTNTIDLRGVKEVTGYFSCVGATTFTVQGAFTDEGGSTRLFNFTVLTLSNTDGITDQAFWHMGSEDAVSGDENGGTLSGLDSPIRLPQRAMFMYFQNGSTVAGTCTARLFLQY